MLFDPYNEYYVHGSNAVPLSIKPTIYCIMLYTWKY